MTRLLVIALFAMTLTGCCLFKPCPQPQGPESAEGPNIEDLYANYMNRRMFLLGTPKSDHAKILSLAEELVDIYEQVVNIDERATDNKKNALLRHGEPIEKALQDTAISHEEKAGLIAKLAKENVR